MRTHVFSIMLCLALRHLDAQESRYRMIEKRAMPLAPLDTGTWKGFADKNPRFRCGKYFLLFPENIDHEEGLFFIMSEKLTAKPPEKNIVVVAPVLVSRNKVSVLIDDKLDVPIGMVLSTSPFKFVVRISTARYQESKACLPALGFSGQSA